MKTRKQLIAAMVGAALAIGSTQLLADSQQSGTYGPGYAMGPGMMYGYGGGYAMGPGMMYGYGPGYGMGPGMMYGYGAGYGMGPGMMYGYGGGYGMGPGMMWDYGSAYGAGPALNLSDAQRGKIGKIREELWSKQLPLMNKMHEEYAAGANARDDATAQQSYNEFAQLRQQMFDNMLAARKQMDGVLTKEQRQQFGGWGY